MKRPAALAALALVVGCGTPRAAAYGAELAACVDRAQTREDSAACRARVRCRYRASEFPTECADAGKAAP